MPELHHDGKNHFSAFKRPGMPKEPRGDAQGCVGERERTSRPASKNAKDKSNSAALLASRARAHTEKETYGRDSRCSEKDSGYSDTGSDSLQTDADDQQSSVNEPQVREDLGGVDQGPIQGSHILVSRTPDLTPIFIIKNVVLKQPGQSGQDNIHPSSLSWGGGTTSNQGATHVLLLQQPGINQSAPMHTLKPHSQRSESKGVKKSTYLPILNSYPRIAPHPNKKTPEKPTTSRGSNTEEHSLSKRVCTEEKREEVSTSTQATKQHLHKQPENNLLLHSHSLSRSQSVGHETLSASHQHRSPCRPSSPSTSLSVSSPSVSSSQTPFPPSSNDLIQSRKEPPKHCQGPKNDTGKGSNTHKGTARYRRFLNTVEILSQSGLLDITLRTQDLLRQNATTERDIAQLRQHANLLFQATQAGVDAPAAWEKLQQVMAESGHYPSLKCLPTDSNDGGDWSQSNLQVEAATSTKPDIHVVYRYGVNGTEEVAPPSPLLAPMPDAEWQSTGQYDFGNDSTTIYEQIRAYRGTTSLLDDPIMPPDSSTHGNLL
ncbi:unnamed protein product [Leuciscus chuanchicus]